MHANSHHVLSSLLAALLCLGSSHASALESACERLAPEADAAPLRAKASRFAPRLAVRVWYRPFDDTRQTWRAQPASVVAAPTPTRRNADVAEPYGWEVGLRWSVIDMADSVGLLEPATPPLTPTNCLRRIEITEDDGEEP